MSVRRSKYHVMEDETAGLPIVLDALRVARNRRNSTAIKRFFLNITVTWHCDSINGKDSRRRRAFANGSIFQHWRYS